MHPGRLNEVCHMVFKSADRSWRRSRSGVAALLKADLFREGIAGEAVDSLVFYPVAFLGLWDTTLVLHIMMGNYLMKVGWEVVVTPVTYRVVAFLKRAESEDFYDYTTNFTPFSIKT